MDSLSRAEQKKKWMLLNLKSGQHPDKSGTAIASPKINYRNNLEEEGEIVALKYGHTGS
jgi:hypothetical protein